MMKKIKHSLTCGITLDNTTIIEENELGNMIVKCIECGKKYFLFRINGKAILEAYNEENKKYLEKRIEYIKKYLSFKELNKDKFIIIDDNLQEIIDYPIGEQKIIIKEIIDKNDGKKIIEKISFDDIYENYSLI